MKHKNKSASPCELACPHLSDHPTQKAKPKQKNDHGRSVPLNSRSLGDRSSGSPHCSSLFRLTNPSSRRRHVAGSQYRSFPSQVLDFTLFHSFSPRQIRTPCPISCGESAFRTTCGRLH